MESRKVELRKTIRSRVSILSLYIGRHLSFILSPCLFSKEPCSGNAEKMCLKSWYSDGFSRDDESVRFSLAAKRFQQPS